MPEKNAFQLAVEQTPEISSCYQAGLKALGKYRNKIQFPDGFAICGSVDLDACVQRLYPNDNRWDYIVCYNGLVYFIEVHGAITSEVSAMLNKLKWLRMWLIQQAPKIRALKAKDEPFIWIQSGKFAIPKTSRQYKLLVQNGLLPKSVFKLG